MDLPYSSKDYEILLEYYNEFLKNRNEKLKKKFLQSLGFSGNIEAQTNKEEILDIKMDTFSDQFFRITKIGKLVVQTFNYFAKNNILSEEDIFNLQDREFSSKLGCWKPILTENKDELLDGSGINRYYSDKIIINNSEYYLCKEWKEASRDKFVPWVKKILFNKNR